MDPSPATPLSRRRMLHSSLAGFGSVALSGLLAEEARAEAGPALPHFPAKAKRVILLFMQGGVSHLDTFDHKPRLNADQGKTWEAGPSKVLGSPWKFSQHGQSGQWISNLFPQIAEHADDLCVLTAMHTDQQAHSTAVPKFHTGEALRVRPSLGAWTVYGLGSESRNLPGFIGMNPLRTIGGQNHGSAFLPASFQATMIRADQAGKGGEVLPDITPKHVSGAQQQLQLDLVRRLNGRRLEQEKVNPELEGVIHAQEMAFRMQTAVPKLIDLSRESATALQRYGVGPSATDRFARQCLLARKFAEAGVRFIEIGTGGWDHHFDIHSLIAKSARGVDQPISALLTDLKRTGMLDETLVIWAGEFGRTPFSQGTDGRDHNNRAFTIWLAGGGVKAGFRHGVTDEFGREGVAGRVGIHDLHATILRLIGLDHERLTYRYSGRDFRLTDVHGHVVNGIIA